MKTRFFKMILPAFVLLVAVTAAFAFKTADEKLAPETGWINLPDSPCAVSVECTTDPGDECTLFYEGANHTAYGKIAPMNCSKTLQRVD